MIILIIDESAGTGGRDMVMAQDDPSIFATIRCSKIYIFQTSSQPLLAARQPVSNMSDSEVLENPGRSSESPETRPPPRKSRKFEDPPVVFEPVDVSWLGVIGWVGSGEIAKL